MQEFGDVIDAVGIGAVEGKHLVGLAEACPVRRDDAEVLRERADVALPAQLATAANSPLCSRTSGKPSPASMKCVIIPPAANISAWYGGHQLPRFVWEAAPDSSGRLRPPVPLREISVRRRRPTGSSARAPSHTALPERRTKSSGGSAGTSPNCPEIRVAGNPS